MLRSVVAGDILKRPCMRSPVRSLFSRPDSRSPDDMALGLRHGCDPLEVASEGKGTASQHNAPALRPNHIPSASSAATGGKSTARAPEGGKTPKLRSEQSGAEQSRRSETSLEFVSPSSRVTLCHNILLLPDLTLHVAPRPSVARWLRRLFVGKAAGDAHASARRSCARPHSSPLYVLCASRSALRQHHTYTHFCEPHSANKSNRDESLAAGKEQSRGDTSAAARKGRVDLAPHKGIAFWAEEVCSSCCCSLSSFALLLRHRSTPRL